MHGQMTDPCIVDGPALSKLVPLLSDVFIETELEQLIRVTFSEGLFKEYVPHGLILRDLVFQLMEALERRGTTDIFLRAVLTARPGRRDLADLILRLCPPAALPEPEAKGQVEVVLSGLTVLKENAVAPDTMHKLRPLLPKFGQLVDGFTTMAISIRLIDFLTHIQLSTPLLASLAGRFTDRAGLMLRAPQPLLEEAEAVSKLLRDTTIELSLEIHWVDQVLESIQKLREAVVREDVAGYDEAILSIRSIARHELPYHSSLLQQTAEDLPLDDLIQVIADVRDHVGLDSISVAAINLSLHALQHLYPRVRGLATRQKRWREIEGWLSLMDDYSDAPTDKFRRNLIMALIRVVSAVEKLVQVDPEAAGLTSIRNYVANKGSLIDLLEKDDYLSFLSFQNENKQFHSEVQFESLRVYGALDSLCRNILEILQPLKSLVEALSR
jgi:hypothetical protein